MFRTLRSPMRAGRGAASGASASRSRATGTPRNLAMRSSTSGRSSGSSSHEASHQSGSTPRRTNSMAKPAFESRRSRDRVVCLARARTSAPHRSSTTRHRARSVALRLRDRSFVDVHLPGLQGAHAAADAERPSIQGMPTLSWSPVSAFRGCSARSNRSSRTPTGPAWRALCEPPSSMIGELVHVGGCQPLRPLPEMCVRPLNAGRAQRRGADDGVEEGSRCGSTSTSFQ